MKNGKMASDFQADKHISCRIWQVSEKAGFYMQEGLDKEKMKELADSIIAGCNALITELGENAPVEDKDGTTDAFEEKTPYLIRRSTGEKFVINGDVFKLGKDASCVDCLIDDNPAISRNHADIVHEKDGFYVRDKGSLNHTFVDGRKLEAKKPVKLENGSLLQLADEVFEFIEE